MYKVEHKNSLGQYHREGGLHAVEYADGSRAWWVNGQQHRDGGLPAVEYTNGSGTFNFWVIGQLPSVGSRAWWVNGQRHREGGLPAVEWTCGINEWWVNGQRHRDGGLPAVIDSDGYVEWWVNGQRHREGGLPAIECDDGSDGEEYKEWWINGRQISHENAIKHMAFCQKMQEKKRIRAQKKLYFWWIQICYDMDHPSGCGIRMAQKNLDVFETMMNV